MKSRNQCKLVDNPLTTSRNWFGNWEGEGIALTHHNAPKCDQWSSCHTVSESVKSVSGQGASLVGNLLLGTKQSSHCNVAPSTKLAVSLNDSPASEVIENKCLMGFGQTELPWETSILDASPARSARTAIVT